MKDKLIEILETIYPNDVYLQGTIAPDVKYPNSFITFFVADTEDNSFFDDDLSAEDWTFSVIFYTNDPTLIETKSHEIITKLKANGFIPQGKGRDIPSDVSTHTGWAMEFKYKKYQ